MSPRRTPLIDRFFAQVRITSWTGCWLWTSYLTNGYGDIRIDSKMAAAHRVAYELAVRPIPDGLHIDHLCRNRGCCNPAHLEAVTHYENTRRAWALMTHCRRGHPFDEENTHWEVNRLGNLARRCRACSRDRARERRRKASKGRE